MGKVFLPDEERAAARVRPPEARSGAVARGGERGAGDVRAVGRKEGERRADREQHAEMTPRLGPDDEDADDVPPLL